MEWEGIKHLRCSWSLSSSLPRTLVTADVQPNRRIPLVYGVQVQWWPGPLWLCRHWGMGHKVFCSCKGALSAFSWAWPEVEPIPTTFGSLPFSVLFILHRFWMLLPKKMAGLAQETMFSYCCGLGSMTCQDGWEALEMVPEHPLRDLSMEEMMRLLNTSIHNLADYSPQEYRG